MTVPAHPPLTRVWTIAIAVMLVTAIASHVLGRLSSPMPAYWVGLVGLLAVGAALVLSWRELGAADAARPAVRRALRGLVMLGLILWVIAMAVPFL